MDLGSGTFTSFKMDESVAGYVAENMELFGCDMSLVHSHNCFSAYFSGTDIETLRSEGNDQNCFVSLIVNNEGKYCAAITRKVQSKKEIITKYLDTSYEFFGEGTKYMGNKGTSEKQTFMDDTIVEYFMLDVEVEHVDNPLAYLDTRFDEIEAKKKLQQPVVTTNTVTANIDRDTEFYDWIHSKDSKPAVSEPALFTEEEMGEVDFSKWEPDIDTIQHMACKILLCSLIVNKDTDLKQWTTRHMEKKYDEMFVCVDDYSFTEWSEFIIEFMLNHYPLELFVEDESMYYSKIALALYNEFSKYPSNNYLEAYKEILTRYINE